MAKRYTADEKSRALTVVQDRGLTQAVAETGISEPTLRRWMASRPKSADELRGELLDLAFELIAELGDRIPEATDRDLYRALQVSIQQLVALARAVPPTTDTTVRFQFQDPDGTTHDEPYWTRNPLDADGNPTNK